MNHLGHNSIIKIAYCFNNLSKVICPHLYFHLELIDYHTCTFPNLTSIYHKIGIQEMCITQYLL